jgi:ribonucleoside-diphosphate reductase alpha chain
MVTVDIDHPDIEQYINWKVMEEQKVASLVAGSKLCNRHLNLIMQACARARDTAGEAAFDPKQNAALKAEIAKARRVMIPENYIQRALQFARQGYAAIQFPTYNTDWDSEAYLTVSGQNSNNSVRVSNDFLRTVETDGEWKLIRRTDGKVAKTIKARELWEQVAHAAWASADPACSSTPRSTSGTPAAPRAGSTPRIRAPSTCSSTTRRAISRRSTCWRSGRTTVHLTSRPSSTPAGCGR